MATPPAPVPQTHEGRAGVDASGRRVIVTGATGFIGAHVARLGVAAGAEVIALGRRPSRIPGVRDVLADLRDADAVRAAVEQARPDGALHLAAAGVGPGGDLGEMMCVNVVGTANLLRAMRAGAPGAPVVLAGSGYEYGIQERPIREDDPLQPVTAYGVSKAAASMMAALEGHDLAVTILRLFNVYGPGERPPRLLPSIVMAAREHRAVDLSEATQVRDFVYAEDVAEGMWRALLAPPPRGVPRVLNVGTGRPIRLRDFIERVAGALRERGLDPALRFGALPMRPGEPTYYAADPRRLEDALGWIPATPLEKGVASSVDSVR